MAIHELKTWREFFVALLDGSKTFEFRRNDRDFKVGDVLELHEFEPFPDEKNVVQHPGGFYTGRKLYREVTYILAPGLCDGDWPVVIMGIKPTCAPTTEERLRHSGVRDSVIVDDIIGEVLQSRPARKRYGEEPLDFLPGPDPDKSPMMDRVREKLAAYLDKNVLAVKSYAVKLYPCVATSTVFMVTHNWCLASWREGIAWQDEASIHRNGMNDEALAEAIMDYRIRRIEEGILMHAHHCAGHHAEA